MSSGYCSSPMKRLPHKFATRISSSFLPDFSASVISVKNGGFHSISISLPFTRTVAITSTEPRSSQISSPSLFFHLDRLFVNPRPGEVAQQLIRAFVPRHEFVELSGFRRANPIERNHPVAIERADCFRFDFFFDAFSVRGFDFQRTARFEELFWYRPAD